MTDGLNTTTAPPGAQDRGELSPEQLAGNACIDCGTPKPPLHPGEAIEVRVAVDVVRDVATVVCTQCLLSSRDTVILATSSAEPRP